MGAFYLFFLVWDCQHPTRERTALSLCSEGGVFPIRGHRALIGDRCFYGAIEVRDDKVTQA